jgi:inhibitor of KinA
MNPLRIQSISPNGDCALIIRFKKHPDTLRGIHALAEELQQQPLPAQLNVIPTTHSLVLVFAEPVVYTEQWLNQLRQRIIQPRSWEHPAVTHEWPVCYDPSVAPDLLRVTEQLGCTAEQLIKWHTGGRYTVHQLGFLPGFVYLDGNHEALDLPRKARPELSVPAGSVAIAGGQTGIYSLSTPGGWHVIGRTSAQLLDMTAAKPMNIKPLDEVRFVAVDQQDYLTLVSA